MVEVEQGALGAFEQDVFAPAKGRLDEPRRVVEMAGQPLAPAGRKVDQALGLERFGRHRRQQQVLVGQDAPDPVAQDVPI